MKLNNQQIDAISQEIVKKVNEENIKKIDRSKKHLIDAYFKNKEIRDKKITELNKKASILRTESDEAGKAINNLLNTQNKNNSYFPYSSVESYYVSRKEFVNLNEIRNKVVLKALFATEADMQTFIDSLVKEYTK